MKFKVGDKVKVRQDLKINEQYGNLTFVKEMQKMKGKTVTIEEVCRVYYYIKEFKYGWTDEMFEDKVNFIKSDLKDGDIVTQRDGNKKTVCDNTKSLKGLNDDSYLSKDNYNDNLIDKDGDTQFDIIKVERSIGYETVYERKEEILDKAEKRYLRDVIRPFRDKVKFIYKAKRCYDENISYICINLENDNVCLPDFEINTMYKNMKANKTYTLEELGL